MTGKNDRPPPLPSEIFGRVLRLATFDGRTLLFFAAAFALLAAANREGLGAFAGCLAAGAGAMELHGVARLRQGDPEGMTWLVRSQLGLLAVILGYALARVVTFDPVLLQTLITPELKASFEAAGVTEEQTVPMLRFVNGVLYASLAIVSLFYQGGMALYYSRRRAPVQAALAGG